MLVCYVLNKNIELKTLTNRNTLVLSFYLFINKSCAWNRINIVVMQSDFNFARNIIILLLVEFKELSGSVLSLFLLG